MRQSTKRFLIIIAGALVSSPLFAITGHHEMISKSSDSCSVRLSNGRFEDSGGQGFCIGTIVSGNILVTAAHCAADLSLPFGDPAELKNGSLNVSIDRSELSDTVSFQAGPGSGYAGCLLRAKSNRAAYINGDKGKDDSKKRGELPDCGERSREFDNLRAERDVRPENNLRTGVHVVDGATAKHAVLSDDFLALKLAKNLAAGHSCPRLPTPDDCAQFKAEVFEPKQLRNLNVHAYYHLTKEVMQNGRPSGGFVPLSSMIHVSAKSMSFDNQGILKAVLSADNSSGSRSDRQADNHADARGDVRTDTKLNVVTLTKTDSGTGLLWDSGHGDVLIGVQSGAYAIGGAYSNAGAFAFVCSHLKESAWVEFASANKLGNAEFATKSGVKMPGAHQSGSSAN